MAPPYIEVLSVKDYLCIRDLEVTLTPFHAFIGPNDSGKSTLLRAARTAVQLAGGTFSRTEAGEWMPFDPGLVIPGKAPKLGLRLAGDPRQYHVKRVNDRGDLADWLAGTPNNQPSVERHWTSYSGNERGSWAFGQLKFGVLRAGSDSQAIDLRSFYLKGARFLHPDPEVLRKPGRLIRDDEAADLSDERGLGLPAIYDHILNRGDSSFQEIVREVQRLFPTIKALRLRVVGDGMKALEVELRSGERVPAHLLSEGLLYYLFYAALRYLEPAALLLIEEPENGLHPARIKEVMRILREVSRTTQVLIATHSPLVINEMQPDEVSVVTRHPETGTQVKRISETPNFAQRSSVYALGELWLSYANGEDEAPLLTAEAP